MQTKEIKVKDCYMKTDREMLIDADFENLNTPVEDPQRKILFMNKRTGVGYTMIKKIRIMST